MHFLQILKLIRKRLVQEISLKELRPNPYQPRKIFQQEAIDELKAFNHRTWNPSAY